MFPGWHVHDDLLTNFEYVALRVVFATDDAR